MVLLKLLDPDKVLLLDRGDGPLHACNTQGTSSKTLDAAYNMCMLSSIMHIMRPLQKSINTSIFSPSLEGRGGEGRHRVFNPLNKNFSEPSQ